MAKPKRVRIDELLVARGLAEDLKSARAQIMAGQVVVGERRAEKAGDRVAPEVPLRVKGRRPHGYVSRGGLKLAGALDTFGVDPAGLVGLDLGASTGGFTDCLLQRGAARIYAVDVGRGLLDWRLQKDPRVVNLERTHARDLDAARVPEPVDLLVADISFNALARLLGPAVRLLAPDAQAVLLVKPQFELPADAVGPGGIVTDEDARARAVDSVAAAVQALGLVVRGRAPAAITGTAGNQEWLLWATCRP
jgi:23S rRNA (cytidine1920-2'-O)/16S rRNA (cytidine1409-2'-O)-methyltransferase